jgi:hypothetical protein
MTLKIITAALVLALAGAAEADAKTMKPPPGCVDRPATFSWQNFLFGPGPPQQPNGCAPAVYNGGEFIGQDPDPNIRYQLNRDPTNEGYHLNVR